jgi:hypothetical protein
LKLELQTGKIDHGFLAAGTGKIKTKQATKGALLVFRREKRGRSAAQRNPCGQVLAQLLTTTTTPGPSRLLLDPSLGNVCKEVSPGPSRFARQLPRICRRRCGPGNGGRLGWRRGRSSSWRGSTASTASAATIRVVFVEHAWIKALCLHFHRHRALRTHTTYSPQEGRRQGTTVFGWWRNNSCEIQFGR